MNATANPDMGILYGPGETHSRSSLRISLGEDRRMESADGTIGRHAAPRPVLLPPPVTGHNYRLMRDHGGSCRNCCITGADI